MICISDHCVKCDMSQLLFGAKFVSLEQLADDIDYFVDIPILIVLQILSF